jgi:hypothetical protein
MNKAKMRAASAAFVLIAALLAVVACGRKSAIVLRVLSARVGDSYKASPPASDRQMLWWSGDLQVGGIRTVLVAENGARAWMEEKDNLLVRSQGGLSGRSQSDQKKEVFATEVTNFIAFSDQPGQGPRGEFWQVLVGLKNAGRSSETLVLHEAGAGTLDAALRPRGGSELAPAGFLVPGMRLGRIALLTSWKGKLAARLAAGEETWLLLLFDVPRVTQEAMLSIGKAELEIKPERPPFGNLSAGSYLNAGSAAVQIVSVGESPKMPVNQATPSRPDSRFVLVGITVVGCPPQEMLRSLDFALAAADGGEFGQPGFTMGNIVGMGGSFAMMRAGSALTLFFEVPRRVAPAGLKLLYRPQAYK